MVMVENDEGLTPLGELTLSELCAFKPLAYKHIMAMLGLARDFRKSNVELAEHWLRCCKVSGDSMGYFPGNEPPITMSGGTKDLFRL